LLTVIAGKEGEEMHGGLIEGQRTSAVLYNEGDKVVNLPMAANETLGIRFHATTEYDGVEFFVTNALIQRNSMQLFLYEWKGSYKKTSASDAVVTQQISKFARNNWAKFEFDSTVGSGEYLAVLCNFTGNVSLAKIPSDKENVALYFNGSDMAGSLQARLNYIHTPKNNLAALSKTDETSLIGLARPGSYVATDGLDRTLPDYNEVGPLRDGKYVGMFFWTWHEKYSASVPRNVTEILKKHPDILYDYSAEEWGGVHDSYFWNEPIYGYYNGKDPWVFRKQAELLADAGVDVIIFDNSNRTATYIDGVKVLLETFAQARADGVKTPQISFLMNFYEGTWPNTVVQLRELYTEIYRPGKYKDIWFYWKGKPLMMAYPDKLNPNDELEAEILEFFNFRPPQPSYVDGQTRPDQWGWCSIYPQQVYYNEDGTPEQITVSVAQNHNDKQGLVAMNGERVFGRHWMNAKKEYDSRENAILYGANFEEQFRYALEVDPEFIFITGWNEWRAGRYEEWMGVPNAFPDQFNDAYSRDIEPSKGELKDHYYYQLVSFVRRFKGVEKPEAASKGKTIDIYSEEDMWTDVKPYFASYGGNTLHRNNPGYLGYHYENTSGRNDIVGAKVTHDNDFVYFMVETKENISSSTDPAWMRLFIDVEGQKGPNWETFEYIINRVSPGEKAVLEKSNGGWNWEKVGDVEYSVKDNRLQIKVPKSMLGINGDKFVVNFKWSDNMQNDGDVMDFYVNGDAAPGGRFKFQYISYDAGRTSSARKIFATVAGCVLAIGLVLIGGIYFFKKKRNNTVKTEVNL
jgi:hypothetical protein